MTFIYDIYIDLLLHLDIEVNFNPSCKERGGGVKDEGNTYYMILHLKVSL